MTCTKSTNPKSCISIHALLAESDTWVRGSRVTYVEFLSTLSLRRATRGLISLYTIGGYFYPRSPCGERLPTGGQTFEIYLISIHALLAESDMQRKQPMQMSQAFLSTLSLRRATAQFRTAFIRQRLFLSTLSLRRATLDFGRR